jgi:4-amino-4-deoxy-L-arabinose transferase-like glycosyltransferase
MFSEQFADECRVGPSGFARRTTSWLEALERSSAPGSQALPLLLLYAGVLTAFASFANGGVSLHHDSTELWAWGKEFQLGYAKHPPLAAWLVGSWFQVMPRSDWSFYLLASLNVAVGVAGVWRVAGVFLGPLGRTASVLFLVLTPAYSLWALKFNVNAPLISIWPWTTYFFLRSVETRRIDLSLSAGLLGGMALLTKYYSIILLATLFFVALLHPERRRYFRSAAPYFSIAIGMLVLAPHAWWSVVSQFVTFDYAVSKTAYSVEEARANSIKSVAGAVGALGIAAGAYAVAFGARFWALVTRAIAGTFEWRNSWVICLTHGPLVLTLAAYFLANVRISSGYLLPAFFSTPIILLVVGQAEITVAVLRRLWFCVVAIWLPLLIASPAFGWYTASRWQESAVAPTREIAIEATRLWREAFGTPLRFVAGDMPLATAATFYSPDTPSYMILENPAHSPWVSVEESRKAGVLILCRAYETKCISGAERFVALRVARTCESLS